VDGVARRWRLNPPPNWPTLPEGWEPDHGWSPDPAWGPAPTGWTLWHRERRAAWLLRHRRSAGVGSAAALTIFVALAGPPSSGTLTEAAPARPEEPPTTGALLVPQTPPERRTEPVVRLERRQPQASRYRRAEPRVAVSGEPSAGTPTRRVPQPRSPGGQPSAGGTQSGGTEGGGTTCRTPSPPPTPSLGGDRIVTVGFTRTHCPSAVRQPSAFPSPTTSGSPEEPSG
jgi:hypothetical protein